MVMERCQQSLKEYVDELDGAAFPRLALTIQEMLMALAHVHRMGVVHRDVSLANFLQSWDSSSVKLCDFGMATEMPKKGLLKSRCGTPSYMAPEVLRGKGYDEKADMWSLGVVAYKMCFGEFPYKPVYHGIEEVIMSGNPKPSFKTRRRSSSRTSKENIEILEMRDLVRMLLDRSPETRSSAGDALQLLPDMAPVGMGTKAFDKTCEDKIILPDSPLSSASTTASSRCLCRETTASTLDPPSRQLSQLSYGTTISTHDGESYYRQLSPGVESFCTSDGDGFHRQVSPHTESCAGFEIDV
jgi:serine/threonine protein kinase